MVKELKWTKVEPSKVMKLSADEQCLIAGLINLEELNNLHPILKAKTERILNKMNIELKEEE